MSKLLERLQLPILIVTFLFSMSAGMFVAFSVARVLGFEADLKQETGMVFYLTMAFGFVVALVAMYVVVNAIQGDFDRIKFVAWWLPRSLWFLTLAALVLWGGSNFIASTPAWALVVILLLVAILLKK